MVVFHSCGRPLHRKAQEADPGSAGSTVDRTEGAGPKITLHVGWPEDRGRGYWRSETRNYATPSSSPSMCDVVYGLAPSMAPALPESVFCAFLCCHLWSCTPHAFHHGSSTFRIGFLCFSIMSPTVLRPPHVPPWLWHILDRLLVLFYAVYNRNCGPLPLTVHQEEHRQPIWLWKQINLYSFLSNSFLLVFL